MRNDLGSIPKRSTEFVEWLMKEHYCDWVLFEQNRVCRLPATHYEPYSKRYFCHRHAPKVADMFGYDQLDQIKPYITDEDYSKLGPRQLDELGDDE